MTLLPIIAIAYFSLTALLLGALGFVQWLGDSRDDAQCERLQARLDEDAWVAHWESVLSLESHERGRMG
jgi:hypothetical protein